MKSVKEQLAKILKVDFLIGENALKNWVLLLFSLFLCIIMIYSSHLIDQKIYAIAKLNEDYRASL